MSLLIPLGGHEHTVELPPCTVFASREKAAKTTELAAPEGISFLKGQHWKIQTETEPVSRRQVTERLRLAGVVSGRPESKASVTPPVDDPRAFALLSVIRCLDGNARFDLKGVEDRFRGDLILGGAHHDLLGSSLWLRLMSPTRRLPPTARVTTLLL